MSASNSNRRPAHTIPYAPLGDDDDDFLESRWKLRPTCFRLFKVALVLTMVAVLTIIAKDKFEPSALDYATAIFDFAVDPSSYLHPFNETFGPYNVLLDGHSHTISSDGKMSPEMLLGWARAYGYNAIIVSDHNTIEGALQAQKIAKDKFNDSITVIPAMEYSSCRIHMNLIGITETIPADSDFPSDEELQQVISRTHKLGGIVSVNHIPWSNKTEDNYQVATLPNHPSREMLVEWGVDAFEVINEDIFDYETYRFCKERNISIITGSDIHKPEVTAYSWTVINARSRAAADILAEIRAGRTTLMFDAAGARPRAYPNDNPAYFRMLPLTAVGSYWGSFYRDTRGMYSFQGSFCQPRKFRIYTAGCFYFVAWCILAIFLYEGVRTIRKRHYWFLR